jgi:hypothetical protein
MTMIIGALVAAALSVAIYFWAVGPLDPLKHARMCVKFLTETGGADPSS